MKKRMLALLLTLCMVVSLLPAQLVVAEGTTVALTEGSTNVIGAGTVTATFKPSVTGTYVFYDTTSMNNNGNEWNIRFPENGEVTVATNRTYSTYGFRVDLVADTTYTVEIRNNANRSLSVNVAPAVYGEEITFPADIVNNEGGGVVGGVWEFEVVPKAPNGVLNNKIGWDNGGSPCVRMTYSGEYNKNMRLDFVEEGTFTLKATDRVEGSYTRECSMTIDVGPNPDQGGPKTFEPGQRKMISFNRDTGDTEYRYLFSCTEDATYTVYTTYENENSGAQINAYVFGEQEALKKESWQTCMGGNQYAEGVRWEMDPGTEYELVFSCGRNIQVEFSFDKVVEPTAVRYAERTISNFVGSSDQLNVVFDPIYSSAPVTHAVTKQISNDNDPNTVVAEVTTNGEVSIVNMRNPGSAELTVTATTSTGSITGKANVESRAPVVLNTNSIINANTGAGVRIRYSFTPEADGEYTFDFTAGEMLWVDMWDASREFSANWTVFGGESNPNTHSLKAGVEYTLDVSCDYTNLGIMATVTTVGGGQVPDFVIPEDATVTKMAVDTKYDLPAEQDTFFTFTAPADGVYSLNTDAVQGFDSEPHINVRQMFTDYIFDGKNSVFSLEEGQTIEVMVQAPKACKLWLEKEAAVTKMEIVSQDKTSTYLMNADPRLTLEDVELKLTYEDGTTDIINGFDLIVFGDTYKGMPVLVEMVVDATTADVFVTCGLVQIQYQVKLEPRMVVGFEAIPAKDFPDIYENTMGFETETPDGTSSFYVYEEATNCAYSFATYRFTWSDSTVEEFHLPMEGANHFHGVPVHIDDDVFDPYSNPWGVGTNTLPIRFGDLTDTLDIEIKASNVASIELLDPGVDEYVLGDPDYFANTEDGWIMHSFDLSGFKLKVNYTDGTTKTFTDADITDFRGFFALLNNTIIDAYPDHVPYTAPGTGKVYMSYMGAEDDCQIKLVEAAVEDGNIIIPETAVDEALADMKDDTVTLDVTTSSTAAEEEKTSSAKLPVASVEKLIEEEVKQVVVEMDSAIVTMDAEALEAIAEQAAGASVTLSVEQVETTTLNEKQQAAIEEKKVAIVISAELICNETKEPIGTEADGGFGEEGKITVKIPFTPEEGFKGTDYMVYYVADNGTIKEVTTAYADGYLIVELEHLSEYVVVNTADEGEDGGLGDPDDSNDPKPTDPTEPTDPKPTDPTEPSKPTDPTEPSKPTEPKPTEPEETTKPTEPAKPTNPAVPDTGDHSSVTTMMLLMLASGALAVVLLLLLRKKSKA